MLPVFYLTVLLFDFNEFVFLFSFCFSVSFFSGFCITKLANSLFHQTRRFFFSSSKYCNWYSVETSLLLTRPQIFRRCSQNFIISFLYPVQKERQKRDGLRDSLHLIEFKRKLKDHWVLLLIDRHNSARWKRCSGDEIFTENVGFRLSSLLLHHSPLFLSFRPL